ncbi:hypothetical protein PR048_023447 [Dryococelus australis]|uniref:Mutator-like transposase domain-containing protein n=1 Tax=Dryococelus australis TaxID=614101 RepID=A0ABQ9GU45_9NEOP|nr:hypothetical protein PR048_023447 [Dryococelus australis]
MDLALHEQLRINFRKAGPDVLNNAGAWAVLTSGIGFSQFENMLGTLDVPAMSHKAFSKNESVVWLEHLEKSISEAGKEERLLAEEKGNVDSDGLSFITVIVDVRGVKATTTTMHHQLSSQQMRVNEVDMEKHRECKDRGKWRSPENPPSHGIIPARFPHAKTEVTLPRIEPRWPWWEVSGLVTRLQRPLKVGTSTILYVNGQRDKMCRQRHVCYKNWNNNRPSAAMEQDITVEGFRSSEQMHGMDGDSSVYARLLQNVPYSRSIHKIECASHCIKNYTSHLHTLASDKTFAVDARKLLKSSITGMTAAARGAIRYCGCAGEQVSDLVHDSENGPLVHRVVPKAPRLIQHKTNNAAAFYASLVAKYNVGLQFQKRRHSWELSPFKKLTGRCPRQTQKKILNKKIECQNARKRRRLSYDDADRPAKRYNLPHQTLTMVQKLNNQKIKTSGHANSELWHDMRRSCLTANNFSAVCRRKDMTSCANLVKWLLYIPNFSTAAIAFHQQEQLASRKQQNKKRGFSWNLDLMG